MEDSKETGIQPVQKKNIVRIHILGSERLRKPCAPIIKPTHEEVKRLAGIMVDTMEHANGIGLAANQVGVDLRLIIIKTEKDGVIKLANPQIIEATGESVLEEGCLSCPGLMVGMNRHQYVLAKGFNIDTESEIMIEASDHDAHIIEHEMQHLEGKLIIDYCSPLRRDIYKRKLRKAIKRQGVK